MTRNIGRGEELQINQADVEGKPHGKGWPGWMREVTIGGFREQGWNAYYKGKVIGGGQWGDVLHRAALSARQPQQPNEKD